MLGLPYTLLTVAGLLVVIGLLQPLAARLNLSHTVLLAVVGVFIGVAAGFLLHTDLTDAFNDIAELILDFPISSTEVLYIFLPVLLFEAALTIDVRRMLEDAAPIFLLAVIAVLVTTAVVGLALWPLAGMSLVVCLLLAAIIATTDPAAVIAIFRDLGAPGRLSRLVEGESLLNDATAIAIFTVLLQILMLGREPSLGEAVGTFLYSSLGGALVGFVGARALMILVPWLQDSRLAEMTLTLALPYIVYILCERYFHVSGVIAVVTAGLVVSALGRYRLDPDNREFLENVWAQLGFWASSLVFVLASILVPRLMLGAQLFDVLLIGIVALGALLARAVVLFGLLPLLSAARLTQRVNHRFKFVILWGGLRGAVTLALALAITENRALDPEVQRFVAILATGFVLFTLLVYGTTLRPIIHLLGIDRLSPIDQALRNQVLVSSLSDVRDAVGRTAAEYHIEERPTRDVLRPYDDRIAEATARSTFDTEIADRDRITLGLVMLANRERELLLQHFRYRAVSRPILEQLLTTIERLSEGARSAGRTGYNRAARRLVTFGRGFRLAHALHRFARVERPLVRRLADRFELLLVSRIVLEELARVVRSRMSALLGARVADILGEIVDQRLQATTTALDALRLQYPAYAQALQRRFLRQSGLRLESAQYQALFQEGLIGRELYNNLQREVSIGRAEASVRPNLDLGLDIRELVRQVPLFKSLAPGDLEKICQLLRPRFAVPGERLIRRGERGNEMYFISSGAVEVSVGKHRLRLGRGDFVGELALLDEQRRRADVTALGYCQLLALGADDFKSLLAVDPAIREAINRVAADRLKMNREERKAG
ncbi:MAG TPA: cation:proton antiporter [Geminicoccaceae bacterium]